MIGHPRPSDWFRLLSVRNYPNYLAVVVAALAVRGDTPVAAELLRQFLLFGVCLYSGIYALNAVLDADLDRLHPVKRERPVASGRISRGQALAFVAALWTVAFTLTDARYRGLYLAFIGVNLLYSLVIKRHGVRNLVAVTCGMRVALGHLVAGQPPLANPELIVLATLFMAAVQQVKFGHEGTRGGERTGAKLVAIAALMLPVGAWAAPERPWVVAWVAFAMVAWVYVPWRFPQLARWLIGADVPEPESHAAPPRGSVVAFDFDGTICDSMALILETVNERAKDYGFEPITPTRLHELRTLSVREIQRVLGLRAHHLVLLARHTRGTAARRMDSLAAIDGMEEALRQLQARGHRLVIVTSNTAANVERFLRARGIDAIEEVVGHGGWGSGLWGKSGQLRSLRDRRRFQADRFVYVGDEIRDVEAARAAGMPFVAVTWGANTLESLVAAGATLWVQEPSQLVAAVEGALGAGAPAPALGDG